MTGTLTPALLDEKTDENGTCFKDAAASAGYSSKSHQVRPSVTVHLFLSLNKMCAKCCSESPSSLGPTITHQNPRISIIVKSIQKVQSYMR